VEPGRFLLTFGRARRGHLRHRREVQPADRRARDQQGLHEHRLIPQRGEVELRHPDQIELAAAAGFAGIELWLNDVYEHVGRGGEVSDVEKSLADHGLIVPCCIAMRQWGEAEGLEYPLMLEEARRRMELAARLGAPYIVATPPREPCDFQKLVDRYRDLLDIGRQVGIRPTFEYISFFRSAFQLQQAWAVVQAVDDPDATLILDAFHSWNSHSTLEQLREIPASRISHGPTMKPAAAPVTGPGMRVPDTRTRTSGWGSKAGSRPSTAN